MSKIERLLVPGATELPDCRCGREMALASAEKTNHNEAEIRIYKCSECNHEMRLIVWLDPPLQS
jgi:DNA-directed RNA polymerase subunit RPC12/RpoP